MRPRGVARMADRDHALVEVDVGPTKRRELADAEPARCGEDDHRVDARVHLAERLEEPLERVRA
jgi:hypothetical protein